MEEATRLFADRGFAGTSLQDIADATGLTRPALYHYFGSKEDLLSRLVSELTEGPADELGEIRRREGATATERLRAMALAVAWRQASQPARFRLLVRSEAELPEALSKVYDQGRRRVLKEFSSVIGEGVRLGQFRPVDPGSRPWASSGCATGSPGGTDRAASALTGLSLRRWRTWPSPRSSSRTPARPRARAPPGPWPCSRRMSPCWNAFSPSSPARARAGGAQLNRHLTMMSSI